MITGKDNILKWFENSDKGFWMIYQYGKSDSSAIVAQSTRDEAAASAKNAYSELRETLRLLNGRYTLAACAKNTRQPREDWREDIEISKAETTAVAPMQAVSGISPDDVTKQINDAILKYKTEQELIQLKKENDQLKKDLRIAEKESSEPLNRIGQLAMQYMPMFLGAMPPPPPQQERTANVAGLSAEHIYNPNNETVDELILTEQENERLSKCVDVFAAAAPGEWLDLLEKLAAKLQANPQMIGMLKNFL